MKRFTVTFDAESTTYNVLGGTEPPEWAKNALDLLVANRSEQKPDERLDQKIWLTYDNVNVKVYETTYDQVHAYRGKPAKWKISVRTYSI